MLRTKIIQHMNDVPYTDAAGHVYRYGEFFPPELSPIPYRISEAYEFFPMSEKEAKEKAFVWYDIVHQRYTSTLSAQTLPDDIKTADENILKEVIGCEHDANCDQECTGAFRIITEELAFLKRMNIPLPRLCPNCRHYERLTLRNPPKFYHRSCTKCETEFETSYAPDRPETIYCEKCYNSEIL